MGDTDFYLISIALSILFGLRDVGVGASRISAFSRGGGGTAPAISGGGGARGGRGRTLRRAADDARDERALPGERP